MPQQERGQTLSNASTIDSLSKRSRSKPPDSLDGRQRFKHWFTGYCVPEKLIQDLLDHHTTLTFAKGSALYERGSPADILYWVRRGLVAVQYPEEKGGAILVRLVGPGEMTGFADFIDDNGRRSQAFEAYAKTNCQVALVTREHLYSVLKTLDPEELIPLLEQLNTAWCAEMMRRLKSLVFDYRRRLELALMDLAETCGIKDSRGVLLTPELSHLDFAEMVGCSRSMVGRLICDMINQGILVLHNRHYILTRDLR
jgi:CRP-like cAMP-binding protein